MLELSPGLEDLGGLRLELVFCLALAWTIVFTALLKGVKSFGKAVYFTALFPYLILTILLCRGLGLPGAVEGILFYIKPRWETLWEVQVGVRKIHFPWDVMIDLTRRRSVVVFLRRKIDFHSG